MPYVDDCRYEADSEIEVGEIQEYFFPNKPKFNDILGSIAVNGLKQLIQDGIAEDSDKLLNTALQSTTDMVWIENLQGERLVCNDRFSKFFGGHRVDLNYTKDTKQDYQRYAGSILSEGQLRGIDTRLEHYLAEQLTSPKVYLEVNRYPIPGDDGNVIAILGLARDITHQQQLYLEAARHEQIFRSLIENSPDLIARFDSSQTCLYINPALKKTIGAVTNLVGRTATEITALIGTDLSIFQHALKKVFEEQVPLEFELKCAVSFDATTDLLIRLTPEFDGGRLVSVLMVGRDISELNTSRDLLRQVTQFDALTGLPNRGLFEVRCQHIIEEMIERELIAVVMILNIDNLKMVNESLGHKMGDLLIQQVASRLTSVLRSYDTVARFGNDEFAILLPKIRLSSDSQTIAEKVLKTFSMAFYIKEYELYMSCSIGITIMPTDSISCSDAMKFADSALHLAKSLGGNRYHFYSSSLTDNAHHSLRLQQELRKALRLQQFELYFQPKVNLSNGQINGAEALIRWRHPQLGMVSPAEFIPLAEETGMIFSVGRWVLHTAALTVTKWNMDRNQHFRVSVNISAAQFRRGDFLAVLQQILLDTGCQPHWLEFEVTESLLLNNDLTIQQMFAHFRSLGITIAIDDFGTGYSALSYLHQFSIDVLKIDRQFVSELEQSTRQQELLKVIVGIAKAFELDLVAEGIETAKQAKLLTQFGCRLGQGFFYARPMPQEAFEAHWLTRVILS